MTLAKSVEVMKKSGAAMRLCGGLRQTVRGFWFLILSITISRADQSVTLAWDPNPESDIAGYNLYFGGSSGNYTNKINAGKTTTNTVPTLAGGATYFFAVTAYNTSGLESDFSNEINYSVPALIPPPPTNIAPTLNPISNLTINEDAGAQAITLSGISAGGSNEVQTLQVTASSSNPSLIPNPTVIYTSPKSTGTVVFASITNGYGSALLTVTVDDGQSLSNTLSRSFTVTINPVNDPPLLSPIADQTINKNTKTPAIVFTVQDVETSANSLTVQASSSNPWLVPTAGIVLGGAATNRTITITPATNQIGIATITVTASDGTAVAARSFMLTVLGNSFDNWRTQSFSASDLADPNKELTLWGDKADPDRDGRENLMEFALGLNPNKKDPTGMAIQTSTLTLGSTNYSVLTYNRRKNEPGLNYIPEVSSDGKIWNGGITYVKEIDVTSLDQTFERVHCQDLSAVLPGSPRFFRMRVVNNGL